MSISTIEYRHIRPLSEYMFYSFALTVPLKLLSAVALGDYNRRYIQHVDLESSFLSLFRRQLDSSWELWLARLLSLLLVAGS